MAGHPQNSHRGLLFKQAIGFGSTGVFATNYSTGTAVMTCDSNGVVDFAGKISIGGSGQDIAQDNTGIDLPGTLTLSGKVGKDISQDSTSLLIPGSLSMVYGDGSTAVVITPNTAGLMIGTYQITVL